MNMNMRGDIPEKNMNIWPCREWSPAWGLKSACRAIISLLADPEADSPLNCDAGNMLRAGDLIAYHSMVKMYRIEHAYSTMPTLPLL